MKTITIFIIIIFYSFLCTSQSLYVEYNYKPNFNSYLDAIPSLKESEILYKYSYLISNGIARFSKDSFYIKSFPTAVKSYIESENIYIDLNKSQWMKSRGRYKKGYFLSKELNAKKMETKNWDWSITNEKKIIAGIECVKAVWLQNVAWFTHSLPYQLAPGSRVFNLPGMILQYESPSGTYEAIKISYVNQIVEIPNMKKSTNEKDIELSIYEIKLGDSSSVFSITNNTIRNKWIKINE